MHCFFKPVTSTDSLHQTVVSSARLDQTVSLSLKEENDTVGLATLGSKHQWLTFTRNVLQRQGNRKYSQTFNYTVYLSLSTSSGRDISIQ